VSIGKISPFSLIYYSFYGIGLLTLIELSYEIEMQQQGQDWFNGLKRFVEECRVKHPIANRDDLKVEEEMQCRIIGGSLIAWLPPPA